MLLGKDLGFARRVGICFREQCRDFQPKSLSPTIRNPKTESETQNTYFSKPYESQILTLNSRNQIQNRWKLAHRPAQQAQPMRVDALVGGRYVGIELV